jgi:hypothetical protein
MNIARQVETHAAVTTKTPAEEKKELEKMVAKRSHPR